MENTTLRDQAIAILAELIQRLEITAQLLPDPDDDVKIDIKSDEAGRLIGRKGQYLESLELVMNRILRRQFADEPSTPWIVLDVDGYCVPKPSREDGEGRRRGRGGVDQERFHAMAVDAAKEVKQWGAPRTIGPYRPGERRIIHLALRDDPEVETVSEPEADANGCKRVTIRKKQP
ncbi:MAG: KH domain-containing protein [Lentisphaeria bacterium]|nr:KH domain-containing protein [Lentisphaeria bacterium]